MAEDPCQPGTYSFAWDKEKMECDEYKALGNAICEGIESGYFQAVAHPDRIFRRRKQWDDDMQAVSDQIISEAVARHIPLELNMHAVACKHQYWAQFWKSVRQDNNIIIGLDVHSLNEMGRRLIRKTTWQQKISH